MKYELRCIIHFKMIFSKNPKNTFRMLSAIQHSNEQNIRTIDLRWLIKKIIYCLFHCIKFHSFVQKKNKAHNKHICAYSTVYIKRKTNILDLDSYISIVCTLTLISVYLVSTQLFVIFFRKDWKFKKTILRIFHEHFDDSENLCKYFELHIHNRKFIQNDI